jgi:hypothetical protein
VKRSPILLTLFLGAAAPWLFGQDPMMDLPPDSETDLVCKVGGETDSEHGRLAEVKLDWRPSLNSLLSGGYLYSTLATTNLAQTNTRILSLSGEYSFGTFGLGGGYDRVVESELLTSSTFTLRPVFESGAWRVEIFGSHRKTSFDSFGFQNVRIVRPTDVIFVSGSAKLDLTNTGLGGGLDYLGEVWHVYASYVAFKYEDFEGTTTVSAIRDASGRITPFVFSALATRLMDRLERDASSRATLKAGLLDNSATVGLDASLGRFRLGLEGGRDTDHLTAKTTDRLTGILSLDTSRRTSLELRGGTTRSDALGTIRFVGLSLALRSIPKASFR